MLITQDRIVCFLGNEYTTLLEYVDTYTFLLEKLWTVVQLKANDAL